VFVRERECDRLVKIPDYYALCLLIVVFFSY